MGKGELGEGKAGKMAQSVKGLRNKHGKLSLIPNTWGDRNRQENPFPRDRRIPEAICLAGLAKLGSSKISD